MTIHYVSNNYLPLNDIKCNPQRLKNASNAVGSEPVTESVGT